MGPPGTVLGPPAGPLGASWGDLGDLSGRRGRRGHEESEYVEIARFPKVWGDVCFWEPSWTSLGGA
eukprot:1782927-Pyramimonas_sp.AAC.1